MVQGGEKNSRWGSRPCPPTFRAYGYKRLYNLKILDEIVIACYVLVILKVAKFVVYFLNCLCLFFLKKKSS